MRSLESELAITPERAEFWARMPGWRPAEAAALLAGLDPDKIPQSADDFEEEKFVELQTVKDNCRLIRRSNAMSVLRNPCRPKVCLSWAMHKKLEINNTIKHAVYKNKKIKPFRSRNKTVKMSKDFIDDTPPEKRRLSYLKLIKILVEAKFSRIPQINRTTAIHGLCDDLKIKMDGDTIRSILYEAEERVEFSRSTD